MDFLQLERAMPGLLDAGVAFTLRSSPGRGKSEFIAETVRRMSQRDGEEWGFATAFLATYTPADLLGFMVPGKDEFGNYVSRFTLPPWMQCVNGKPVTAYKRGILFLDEFGQAEGDVKRAAAEILLNGRCGPHQLPEGWSVICAENFASDRSGVTKSFDFVINRRMEIDLKDNIEAWERWATRHGVDPGYITFAVKNPNIVFSKGVPDKQGPWCTPRSLVLANKVHRGLQPNGKLQMDEIATIAISGMIGQEAAAQLTAMLRLGDEMADYADILKDPQGAKMPGKPDAKMLACYELAARCKEAEMTPVVDYVQRMPKEFGLIFGKAACGRDPDLVNTKAMGDWFVKNATLMSAVMDGR